jgi:hypothetical protein
METDVGMRGETCAPKHRPSPAVGRHRDFAVVVVWGPRERRPFRQPINDIADRVYLRHTLTPELPNPDQG